MNPKDMTAGELYEYLEDKYGEDMRDWPRDDPYYVEWNERMVNADD